MPAQPYARRARRFANPGVSGLPADVLALNRVQFLQNMRSYQPGTIQPRSGTALVTASQFPNAIHSLMRLNDPTPFATVAALRLIGNGTVLWSEIVATSVAAALDTGYSGNPLTIVTAAPPQSPRPYAYVADSTKQRKINTDSTIYPIGIAQPLSPPAVSLAAPGATVINEVNNSAAWAAAGGTAGAPSTQARINTTIAAILYDSGTSGYCSINPTAFTNINVGCRMIIAAAETVIVDEIIPAVATTTIATIVYDAGTTGLCWIQPTASLGTGILDPVPNAAYLVRQNAGDYGVTLQPGDIAGPLEFGIPPEPPLTPTAPRTRVVDFPVNGLMTLGGTGETVRILAIAIGPDGIQAIRCSTANAHAAGDSITGVACFRCSTTGTRAATNTLVENCVQTVITPVIPAGQSSVAVVAGISAAALGPINGALTGGRATLAEDVLKLSIKIDQLSLVNSVRLYLDVDAATNDFLHNYFMAEWRASDIAAAIPGSATADVSTITDAKTTQVINDQIDPGPGAASTGDTGSPAA